MGEKSGKQVVETILSRRSVRVYWPEQIKEEDLKEILKCGIYAPTGGNLQESRFLVLQETEDIDRLNQILCRELASRKVVEGQYMNKGILAARKEGTHFFYHAPTVITAVAPQDHGNAMADCALGLGYMQLAVSSLGLGSCWANQPHWLTDVPEVRDFFYQFGMKEEEDIYGTISIGYIQRATSRKTYRKKGRVVIGGQGRLELAE